MLLSDLGVRGVACSMGWRCDTVQRGSANAATFSRGLAPGGGRLEFHSGPQQGPEGEASEASHTMVRSAEGTRQNGEGSQGPRGRAEETGDGPPSTNVTVTGRKNRTEGQEGQSVEPSGETSARPWLWPQPLPPRSLVDLWKNHSVCFLYAII